jgi:hypothetical protein
VQADPELGLDPRGRRGRDPGGGQARSQLRGECGGGRPGLAAEQAEEDHADHRDADRGAELDAGVKNARCRPGVLPVDPGQQDVGERRDHGAHAQARHNQAGTIDEVDERIRQRSPALVFPQSRPDAMGVTSLPESAVPAS